MKCSDLLDLEEDVRSECLLVDEHRLRLLSLRSKFHALNAHSLKQNQSFKGVREKNTKREETIEKNIKQDQTNMARLSKSG